MAVAPKGTKKSCPCIRPCASRRVRLLHRCFRGRLTRAIPGPLSLSPHPCGSLPYATIPRTLLKGAFGIACWFVQIKQSQASSNDLSGNSDPVPVRRPSGGAAQGDARQGRRARNDGAGTPHRDGPRSGTGRRGVWLRSGQTWMSGALFLWLLSCWASNKKVTRPGGRNQKYRHTR